MTKLIGIKKKDIFPLWSGLIKKRDSNVLRQLMEAFDPMPAIAKHAELLFFSYDLAKKSFNYSNPAFREFFDLSAGQSSTYQRLLAMVHPDDRQYLHSKLEQCSKGKAAVNVEFRVVRGASNERWLRLHVYRIEGQMIAGHAGDITSYKEYNNNMNIHNSKKNAILNILAHDLAGPLGTIGNLAELSKREIDKGDLKGVDKYTTLVSKISKDGVDLIRSFLNQEFLESQGVQLLKRRAELVAKISTVIKKYVEMQQDLKLQFSSHASHRKIYAEIDEDKFMQVINNLISNAMKFTPDGGKIHIEIEKKEHHVLISVADTGIGIPEKYHATLFDKFTPARRSGLKGQPSTGLGMSIIKTIVEWHQGQIWFDSTVNKGTTFYIQIPK